MRETKTILLVDSITVKQLHLDVLELIKDNISVVPDLNNLTHEDLVDCKHIIVMQDFAKLSGYIGNITNKLKTFQFLYDVKIIYIYNVENEQLNLYQKDFKSYKVSFENIDSSMLESCVYGNIEELAKEFSYKRDENLEEIAENLSNLTNLEYLLDHVPSVRMLALDYLKNLDRLTKNEMALEVTRTEKDLLREDLALSKKETELLSESLLEITDKLKSANNRILRYSYLGTPDVRETIDLEAYPESPIILYFKQYSELIHLNEFLRILHLSILTKAQLSCKVLRLVDKKYYPEITTLPDYYYVALESFNLKKVNINDFIVKNGDYVPMLGKLLENKMKLNVLVIYDARDTEDLVVNGNIIRFNVCRNFNKISQLGLDFENTICNNSDSNLSWNTDENYQEFKDNSDYVYHKLSNQKVIVEILKTLEYYIKNFILQEVAVSEETGIS